MANVQNDPVVTTLLRIAADPRHYEALADVLLSAGAPEDEDRPDGQLTSLAALAALSRARGEGAEPLTAELGVVLVSSAGRVLACNAMAEAALQGMGRAEPGARLEFHDEANAQSVRAAVAEARRTGQRIGLRLEGPQRPRFASAVAAEALMGHVDLAGRDLGALLIFAASGAADETWDMLRQSFGLTEAESRLARTLAEGLTLQQAADELGVSVHTVRNQLRAVFDKIGVQRQSDLVRAVHEYGRMAGALPSPAAPFVEAPAVQRLRLSDGRRLAFREYGDPAGRAVLCFHEGMGSSLLPPGAGALAWQRGLRILAPERPGFGLSDPPPPGFRWFEGVADDMLALLADRGVDRVRIAAVLSSAPCALHTAERLGERAELVLLCSGRAPRRTRIDRASSLYARMRAGMEAQPWAVEALFAILRLRVSPQLTRQMIGRTAAGTPGDAAYLEAHPEFADYVCQYVGECFARTSRGPAHELSAFRRGENEPAPRVAAPLAVWHGGQGDAAPLDDLIAYLGAPPTELRVFDDIGLFVAARYWPEILDRLAA